MEKWEIPLDKNPYLVIIENEASMNVSLQGDFQEVAEIKADSKNRISLGRKIQFSAKHYRVYQDPSTGRILLEPLLIVPISEPWLDKNPEAKKSVERGLAQLKSGKLIKASEDFSKYVDNTE